MKKRLVAVLAFGLLCAVFLSGCGAFALLERFLPGQRDASSSLPISVSAPAPEMEEYTFHDMTFSVPTSLTLTEEESSTIAFYGLSRGFTITSSETTYIVSRETVVEEMLAFYQNNFPDASLSEVDETDLNGTTWDFFQMDLDDGRQREVYLFSAGWRQYSMIFDHLQGDDALREAILPTVVVDAEAAAPQTAETFDADAAAASLVGEWDAGSGGYYVFGADGTLYCYQDDSKSADNVFEGTWEVDGPLLALQTQEVVGFTVNIRYTNITMDGESQDIDQLRVNELYPKGPDAFLMEDVTVDAHYNLTRVV